MKLETSSSRAGCRRRVRLAACGKKEPPPPPPPPPAPAPAPMRRPRPSASRCRRFTLGKAVAPTRKSPRLAEAFAKGDTIHASIDTTGAGSATLWRSGPSPGRQDGAGEGRHRNHHADRPGDTEFHISKPDGWPAGDYAVEICSTQVGRHQVLQGAVGRQTAPGAVRPRPPSAVRSPIPSRGSSC